MTHRIAARVPRGVLVSVTAALAAAALAVTVALPSSAAPTASSRPGWITGWAASPMGVGPADPNAGGFTDTTFRNVVRAGASGERVRVRLSNVWGDRTLEVSEANVAARTSGAATDRATVRPLTFDGDASPSIPRGAELLSDPVTLSVAADTDLAVSLHTPGPTGPPTWHQQAVATSYRASGAARAASTAGRGWTPQTSWYFLSGVEVYSGDAAGTIVAIGDSLTDGVRATVDANTRYPDYLRRELQALPAGERLSVVNAGIGGNRLLTDSRGTKRYHDRVGKRFSRDVLGQAGVEGVVVLIGTNDLASYGGILDEATGKKRPATLGDFKRYYELLAARTREADIPLVAGTIPPAGSGKFDSKLRNDVNDYIRSSGLFDGVADFDKALRDPDNPRRMLPSYASSDLIHPSDAGNAAMAAAVPTGVFTGS